MEQVPPKKTTPDASLEAIGKLVGGAFIFAVIWFDFDAFVKYESENMQITPKTEYIVASKKPWPIAILCDFSAFSRSP